MRHKKQSRSKTVKYFRNIFEPIRSVIKNAELDKHRHAFLGKPGSKLWQEFYADLIKTKRRLFDQDLNDKKERVAIDTKRKTLKIQEGGVKEDEIYPAVASKQQSSPLTPTSVPADNTRLAELIKKLLEAMYIQSKQPTKSSVASVTENRTVTVNEQNPESVLPGTGTGDGSEKEPDVDIGNEKKKEKNRPCGVTLGWLVDLFETRDMKDLLIFTKKQVDAGVITVPDNWKDRDGSFDPTNMLKNIIQDPKKGPCNAEDIKVDYIPFFLQVYMQLVANMKILVERKRTNDIFAENNKKTETKREEVKPVETEQTTPIDNKITVNNFEPREEPLTVVTKEPESVASAVVASAEVASAVVASAVAAAVAASAQMTSKGGAPKEDPATTEKKSSKVRRLILFSINLLRNMNMYANPLFFDDLYYYYYFLGLDKVLPSMDDFFRMLDTPPKQEKKNNSKVNVKMRVYQQFQSDNPDEDAQKEKHYGYEMVETRTGADPQTNFDWFLNLVQLHPDFYYKLPVVAEAEKEFQFQEVPVKERREGDKKEGPQNVHIQVLDVNKNKDGIEQRGGGLFDSIYSVFGVSSSAGLYRYLDDSPLPRNFEDVLKDEYDVFDGNVYLCIYSLDNSCDFDGNGPTPFLKFITTKNGGDKWGFPSFHYKSLQDHDENNQSFKCEMYDAVMKTMEIHLCDRISGGTNEVQSNENEVPGSTFDQQPIPQEFTDSGRGSKFEISRSESAEISNENVPVPVQEEQRIEENVEQPLDTSPEQPTENQVAENMEQSVQEEQPIEESTEQPLDVPSQQPIELQNTENEEQPVPEPLDTPTPTPISEQEQEQEPNNGEDAALIALTSAEVAATAATAKEGCGKIDSALDAMFIGLVMENVEGVRQLFVFLNYDYLETLVQTPENKAQNDLLFCRNDDTQVYPIADSNTESKLKWATVDELHFKKKILTEEVEQNISAVFAKRDSLWNIEDSEGNYVPIPFLVYAVEKTDDGKFKTVETEQNHVARFEAKGKIENYGTPKEEGDEGIADEYDARYCFTPTILGMNEPVPVPVPVHEPVHEPVPVLEPEPVPEPVPESSKENEITGGGPGSVKRYAMFAWKTRYVVTDEQVEELKSQTQVGGEQKDQDQDDSPKETREVEGEEEKETPKETLKEEDQDLEKPEELENPVQPHGESALKLDLDEEPSEKEKDQMALERLKFPTIYTITKNEFTDNKPVVMWGVLNSKQFAGL